MLIGIRLGNILPCVSFFDDSFTSKSIQNSKCTLSGSVDKFCSIASMFYLTVQFNLHSVDLLVCLLKVVLFDIGTIYHKLGNMKNAFWNRTHIGIPDPDTESNDAVVLGYLVAQFIGEVKNV